MAEQKTEDTKPPVARRGARPFVGPAGAAPAARPLLRPAAPPARPGLAPFAPPLSPNRASLGVVPRTSAPAPVGPDARVEPVVEAPVVEAPVVEAPMVAEPPIEPVAPAATAPTFEITVSNLTPTAPLEFSTTDALPEAHPAPETFPQSGLDDLDFGFGPPILETEAMLESVESADTTADPFAPRRPVTSEMIAIDAFSAFDSVWGPGNTPAASPTIEPPPVVPSPALDAESLGTGAHAESAWADEIAATPEHHDVAGESSAHVDATESPWARVATPNSALPAWLMDDEVSAPPAEATLAPQVTSPAEMAAPAETVEVTYAAETAPVEQRIDVAAVEPPRDDLREDAPHEYAGYVSMPDAGEPMIVEATVTPPESSQVDQRHTHGLRVSAALDRLAERIRGGEIDVSSVAPEAPDAAVLASVLAALLGGSSSR
jgi:hypothetical protein